MPTYRVIIDGHATGETVIASSYADAYFDVASTVPLTYQTAVTLLPVEQDNSINKGKEVE